MVPSAFGGIYQTKLQPVNTLGVIDEDREKLFIIRYPSAFSHKVGLGLSLQKERLAAAGMLNALFAPYEQVKFFRMQPFSTPLILVGAAVS